MGRVIPSTGNGLVSCRPPPDPLREWFYARPGPEQLFYVWVPALSTTRPIIVLCLLTNELLSRFLWMLVRVCYRKSGKIFRWGRGVFNAGRSFARGRSRPHCADGVQFG